MTTKGESDTVFLRDGWKKIVKDENLTEPTFLVFEFDDSCVIHFCVYEHGSMCKRMRSPMGKEVIEVESDEENEEEVVEDEDSSTKGFYESPRRKNRGNKKTFKFFEVYINFLFPLLRLMFCFQII